MRGCLFWIVVIFAGLAPAASATPPPLPSATPFYGRCAKNLDGNIVCVKFPGEGKNECQISRDCEGPTPTPAATSTSTPAPTPTPALSCVCACRATNGDKQLVCAEPWVFRLSRFSNTCPDQERGVFPWSFEREARALPVEREANYCEQRWNGKEGAGYADSNSKPPGDRCILEQCREGHLRARRF